MCHVVGARRECCRVRYADMIDVYYTPGSPACRFVLLVTAALAIPVNRIFVDLKKDEQMQAEFIKINPQHSVPTINDSGYILWESRAIARYLVNQYSEGSELYPLDPQERGMVDQRLDFDLGTLCPAFSQYFYPQLFSGMEPNDQQKKKVDEAMKLLNTFLDGPEYVAGTRNMSIADLSIVTTVSTMEVIGLKLEALYPNVVRWLKLMKSTTPGYDKYNEAGLQEFKKLVEGVNKARSDLEKRLGEEGKASRSGKATSTSQKSDRGNKSPATSSKQKKSSEYDTYYSLTRDSNSEKTSKKKLSVHDKGHNKAEKSVAAESGSTDYLLNLARDGSVIFVSSNDPAKVDSPIYAPRDRVLADPQLSDSEFSAAETTSRPKPKSKPKVSNAK